MTESENELLRYLAEEWTGMLVQILESMTDQKPKVAWKAASAPEAAADVFWWEQRLSLAEVPLIWIGAPEPAWKELGGRTLRAAGIETVEEADARNTYLEILRQSLSGLAQSLGSRAGREVTCTKGDPSTEAPAEAEWVRVVVTYEDAELPPIHVGFSRQLVEDLEHAEEERHRARSVAVESPEKNTATAPGEFAAPGTHTSRTLDLLLDVELPVSVSFGRAELPLKDVLKLTTGSIVELNRGVSEPVLVIVNNCVVARGEVVVMDGNYGVRINHIITPNERLRVLR